MRQRRIIGQAAAVVLLAMVLAGCGGSSGTRPDETAGATVTPHEQLRASPLDPHRREVINAALRTLGTPYRYGGNGPRGFDCSGLVQYSHAAAGVRVPRVTSQQRRQARPVALSQLTPGDLLFFEMEGKGRHVGIYLGDGEFIHAPSSGKRVSVSSLNLPYWRARLVAAGSYL